MLLHYGRRHTVHAYFEYIEKQLEKVDFLKSFPKRSEIVFLKKEHINKERRNPEMAGHGHHCVYKNITVWFMFFFIPTSQVSNPKGRGQALICGQALKRVVS